MAAGECDTQCCVSFLGGWLQAPVWFRHTGQAFNFAN
jgi:hypothetical protein